MDRSRGSRSENTFSSGGNSEVGGNIDDKAFDDRIDGIIAELEAKTEHKPLNRAGRGGALAPRYERLPCLSSAAG
jgi:hypothetical protein